MLLAPNVSFQPLGKQMHAYRRDKQRSVARSRMLAMSGKRNGVTRDRSSECYASTNLLEADFRAFDGGKGIFRQQSVWRSGEFKAREKN